MIIYFLQTLALFIIGYGMRPQRNRQRKKAVAITAMLILFFISAFRGDTVGADTQGYVGFFRTVQYYADTRYENGFEFFVRTLNRICDNPRVLLIASSAICIGCVCIFAERHSRNIAVSMILYITLGDYFSQMNVMRQALATAFALAGSMMLLKDRKLWGAFAIILASLFHNVAVVLFIPYIIWTCFNRKIQEVLKPRTVVFWALGLSGAAFLLYGYIMQIVVRFFPYFATYFTGTWSDANYSASLANTMIQVVFLIAGSFYFKQEEFDQIELYSAMMIVFATVFSTLSMRMEVWSRVAGMFTIYTILLWIPAFTTRIKNTFERAFIEYGIIMFSVLYMLIVLVFRPEWTRVVPYTNGLFI